MTDAGEIQVVVFGLGDEEFALPVVSVREILDHQTAFRVPNAPVWLCGLIDVRGLSVPVVDLRQRLGLASRSLGAHKQSEPAIVTTSHPLRICDCLCGGHRPKRPPSSQRMDSEGH